MAGVNREFGTFIEFHGTCHGEPCFNQLVYFHDAVIPTASSVAVTLAAYNTLWPALQPILSDGYILASIQAIIYQTPPTQNKPRHIRIVNETGDVTGEALGPDQVFTMVKIPDNTTIYPDVTPLMDVGSTGWSGIPESAQDDGILTDAAIAAANTAFEAFEELTVTFGATPFDLNLGIVRNQNTIAPGYNNPITKVNVVETYCNQVVGRRGTRRY